MKSKLIITLLVALMCFNLTACGDGEVKLPTDCPDTKWTCEPANASFTVSSENKVIDASVVNKDGKEVAVSFTFSDMSEGKVSITTVDGAEALVSGTCKYKSDEFTMTITDIYNSDFSSLPIMMTFKRSNI